MRILVLMKAKAKLPLGEIFSPNRWNLFCQQMKSPPDFSRRSQMDLRQCSASQTDRGTRKCQMVRDNIVRGEKLHCARTEIGRGLAKKCPWQRLAVGRHMSRGCMDQLLILTFHDFFCRNFVNQGEKSVPIYTNLRDEVDCSGLCEFAETIWQLQRPLTE